VCATVANAASVNVAMDGGQVPSLQFQGPFRAQAV
jgi:hypothetical protein